ncbi:hypothetical protein OLMES_2805 [Oleiphilus messinensis]|uniref:histidine kinase n=1 Tax=Oleiphilus messinensis TaxID=141451 RepID=A0A1Y0IBV0_9GAMM|nr:PAS domain-containing protein [Oleiphilus messinensis]ARU56853.1 hypothetical protein OLMES_2805 [Oleiphilus messinensis]
MNKDNLIVDHSHISDTSTAADDAFSNQNHYLRKELYQLLQQDDLVFEFLQEGALDGIWYWDLENPDNEWMSDKFWTLLGYEPDDKKHLAAEWQDIIFEADLKTAVRNLQKHLEDPNHPYDQIVRYKHKQGHTIWVRCRGVAIYDVDGKPIRLLGAHNDFTPIMKHHQALVQERIDNADLTRRVDILSQQIAALKAENESLKVRIQRDLMYSDETGLLNIEHFRALADKRVLTAQRLNLSINVIVVSIANAEHICRHFGDNELNIKMGTINRLLIEQLADMLMVRISDMVVLFSIGYPKLELESLCSEVQKIIHDHNWSIVIPDITIGSASLDSQAVIFDNQRQNYMDILIQEASSHKHDS